MGRVQPPQHQVDLGLGEAQLGQPLGLVALKQIGQDAVGLGIGDPKVGLVGLARTSRQQKLGVALALAIGGAMGLYQMAKGAHYLSHTLVTMLVAWWVFLFWRRIWRLNPSNAMIGNEEPASAEQGGP